MHAFWKGRWHLLKRSLVVWVFICRHEKDFVSVLCVCGTGWERWMTKMTVVCFGLPHMGVCVCFCLAVSVGTMALLRCCSHRRPDAWPAGLGLAKARLAGSGDHPVPFKCGFSTAEQVTWIWRQSKKGWIAGCPLPQTCFSQHKQQRLVGVAL